MTGPRLYANLLRHQLSQHTRGLSPPWSEECVGLRVDRTWEPGIPVLGYQCLPSVFMWPVPSKGEYYSL